MRLSAGTGGVLDMCRDSWERGFRLIMGQHTNTPSRPATTISLLLALILPTSMIADSLAVADTTTSQPVMANASVMTGNTGGGGSSDPSRS